MKILITGAKGMLGTDLSKALADHNEVISLSRNDLDVTKREDCISVVKSYGPDIVVNCAAYTMVDVAEKEVDLAFAINGNGAQNVALACEEAGIPICHISTDYVFDGERQTPYTPFDSTNPLNTYGESKLAGEEYIKWISSKFYIVRTSWLYGEHKKNFVYTIQKLASEDNELRIVCDQIGSPTWTMNLAKGIGALIDTGAYGIYNITDDSEGGVSWYGFAQEIVRLFGKDNNIVPIPTDEYPTPAKRPRYSVLDLSLNEPVFGHKAPAWDRSLSEFISTIK
ncbi:MAG: dTDP-4-dehydrorhamnose reductase [Nitrospirota bacterium]|nr:MAG: dTDP-4-dehydrorhamnose reductase [Nitrospirota bacterium]